MSLDHQLAQTKSRLRDWWDDPAALGRPLVLCSLAAPGITSTSWDYFTYPRMLIKLLGNDDLKPLLRAASDAPYRDIPPLPKAPSGMVVDETNPRHAAILQQVARQVEAGMTSPPFGDTVPIIRSQAGVGFPGSCLGEHGCIPTTGPATIWYETVRRWPELEDIALDRTSPWWQLTMTITRKQLQQAPPWLAVGFPSMAGSTDILQCLRGTGNLLRDMLTEKARVTRVLDRIHDAYREVVDAFWREIKQHRDGSGGFIGIWAPGNAPGVQCDALAYLGPRQARDFAFSYIARDLEQADHGTYHLDGPDAVKFVDDILQIPGLDLIQWVHGAGNPDGVALCWYPLVKKVLAAGKRIMLYTRVDRVPHFMRRLQGDGVDPKAIVFNLGTVRDFEVQDFLPWLEMEPAVHGRRTWYPDDFWEDYGEMMRDDPRAYDDMNANGEAMR